MASERSFTSIVSKFPEASGINLTFFGHLASLVGNPYSVEISNSPWLALHVFISEMKKF